MVAPTTSRPRTSVSPARGLSSFDKIREKCALLLGDDLAEHCAAYLYLRRCQPFQRVLQRLHLCDLNLFDLAALLAPGSTRGLAYQALGMLSEELAARSHAG